MPSEPLQPPEAPVPTAGSEPIGGTEAVGERPPGLSQEGRPRRRFALSRWRLWSEADPTLRTALLILVGVCYFINLPFPSSIVYVFKLTAPLANFLMDRFQLGDIAAFLIAQAFGTCLLQSLFAVMIYFACGWPPAAGRRARAHGLGPALRATAHYLLAQFIFFWPYSVLFGAVLVWICSSLSERFNLALLYEYLQFFPFTLLALAGGIVLNGLLALTLGLGAYGLASRLGRRRRAR
jgi:hypothetical protein